MHVRFTQIKERVTAAPGYSLLAKAVSSAVSVAKATNRVRRDKCFCGYSCGCQWPFLVNRFVTSLRLEK